MSDKKDQLQLIEGEREHLAVLAKVFTERPEVRKAIDFYIEHHARNMAGYMYEKLPRGANLEEMARKALILFQYNHSVVTLFDLGKLLAVLPERWDKLKRQEEKTGVTE